MLQLLSLVAPVGFVWSGSPKSNSASFSRNFHCLRLENSWHSRHLGHLGWFSIFRGINYYIPSIRIFYTLKRMKFGGLAHRRYLLLLVDRDATLISQGPERSETLEACCTQEIWLRILGGPYDWEIWAVYFIQVYTYWLLDIYIYTPIYFLFADYTYLAQMLYIYMYSIHAIDIYTHTYTYIHCIS